MTRDTYYDVGHRVGASSVYYIMPGGKLDMHPYESVLDVHGDAGLTDERELNALAAGRIDHTKRVISVRETRGRERKGWRDYGRNELSFIVGILQKAFPDYRIVYYSRSGPVVVEGRLFEARIIAYHGTGSRITQFHDSFLVPHYFTQDMDYAKVYMGGKTGARRTRDYLVTVELTIDRMFDTKTDEVARAYYNEKFVPFINPHRQRIGKPLAPEIAAGEWPSFTVADHLWGFMLESEAPYDGMLIDEGGLTDAPAIIPFHASQIKVLKNQIVKLDSQTQKNGE